MTIRIAVKLEDSYRMDEYAYAWNGKKLAEKTYDNNIVEKAFSFYYPENKRMFLLKFPLLFDSARVVAEI